MDNPLIKVLQEAFGNMQNLTPQKLQEVVRETIKHFTALQGQIKSDDPKVREQALQNALELQKALTEQAESICMQMNLDPDQINAFTRYLPKESEELTGVKEELENFKNEFGIQTRIPTKKIKIGLVG